MKFGLEQHIIDTIIAVFEANAKVDKAFIFGSRAKGNYRPDSDIDIAIKGFDISTDDIIKMGVAFEENGIKHKFDLIDYNSINEPALKDHIDRVGIEFYRRWKEYIFSDFVKINPTVSLKGNEEYSFIEMKDLEDGNKFCSPSSKRKTSSGARFQERDTLFARITPCLENGKISQVRNLENGIGFGSTEFLVFRGKENVSDNDFVFYLSRWGEVRDFAENNFEGTSGRQRVPKNCFDNLVLNFPPLIEQTAIASILSSLDDKIDLLHRQNKTLEQLAETLFRQMMSELGEKGLKDDRIMDEEEILKSSNPKNHNSDKGEESWEVGTLGDLVFVKYGKDHKKLLDGKIPVFGSGGVMRYADTALYNEESVLIPRKGTLNNVIYIDEPFWTVDTMFYTVMKKPNLAKFIFHFVKKQDLSSMNIGSAVPSMTAEILNNMEIIIPPDKVLKEFDSEVSILYKKIKSNQTQIRTLTKLRDTLLPKLMTGEVRVQMSELGLGGLKDDRIREEKEILQSSNPKNHNSDK